MLLGASALSLKAPDGWTELGILAVAIGVSFLVGKRVVGYGYALCSVFVALLAFVVVGNVAIPVAIALVAIALLVREHVRGPLPARPDSEFPIQVLVVWAGLALYTLGRYAAQPDASAAFRNTDRIMEFEAGIHSYFEAEFQQFLLRYDTVVSFTNWVYSFAFLAITGSILFWLWAVDTQNYRLLRNSLGISALLAVPTLALFPVAPPRLVADSGLIDSIAAFGREHAFANEYAAVPSLHVGWMALGGFVLGRSIGGRLGWLVALSLGPLMLLDVVATGNHFWIDGAIGIVYCLGAAFVLILAGNGFFERAWARVWAMGAALGQVGALTWNTLAENPKARFSFVSLGALLTYLIVGEYVNPGFTDFWGYLTAQVAVFLILLIAAEVVFAGQGGLSWLTHIIAVFCAFADVLGTDGNLYARLGEYDKVTHLAGTAALTAGIYDCLRAMVKRGWIRRPAVDRLYLSIATGIAIGIAWEVYELLGDKVFNTARVNSRWDTGNDIFSDSLGAIAVAAWLFYMETREVGEETQTTDFEIARESSPEFSSTRER